MDHTHWTDPVLMSYSPAAAFTRTGPTRPVLMSPCAKRRPGAASRAFAPHGAELADDFEGVVCADRLMTIAGFGSLLSETSARSTFPDLRAFRMARVDGFRRVFAHACDIFYERGIAREETGEVSSLSVEEHPGGSIVVTLFEVEATPQAVEAFIQREHEFRFVAVQPRGMDGGEERPAVRPFRPA